MLMLCLAIGRPPGTPVLGIIKYSIKKKTVHFLGREPGDIGLFPKPGLLSFRKTTGRSDRLGDRTIERPCPSCRLRELAIADRLKGGKTRAQTLRQQAGNLLHPSLLDHLGHSARDLIV